MVWNCHQDGFTKSSRWFGIVIMMVWNCHQDGLELSSGWFGIVILMVSFHPKRGRTEPPRWWSALRARYTKTVGAANRASRDARAVVLLRLKVDLHLIDIPAADILRDLREKSPRPCTLRVLPHRPTRNLHESARKCSMATECRRKAECNDCKIQQKMHCGR